jgi:hypothetical protein
MDGNRPADDFADVRGSPGAGARLRGFFRVIWPLAPILAGVGYLLRAAWPRPDVTTSAAGFGLLLLAGAAGVFLALSRRRLARSWKGAVGEEMVAGELGRLPAPHVVLHGLPRGRDGVADIDHVVIGPSGVFVVETKNWSGAVTIEQGRLLCDGWSPARSPVEQVKSAAASLKERIERSAHLNVPVHAVLVFVSPSMRGVCRGVGGVRLCGLDRLAGTLTDPSGEPLPEGWRRQIAEALEGGLPAL